MKVYRTISYFFLIITSLLFLSGCVNTRFLDNDEKLFIKNKVEIDAAYKVRKKKSLAKEVEEISQLQPNKKLIGLFKLKLWFYNVANRRKENKFRYWMKNKIGEPPVLFDSTMAAKSVVLVENYLINKGYFYSKVNFQTRFKKRRAWITYQIQLTDQYKINTVNFPQDENWVAGLIRQNKGKSYLEHGGAFNVSNLKLERERITDDMKMNGFYYFNKEYIYFDLDSSKLKKQLDIYVRVSPPNDSTEHQQYHINNVYVYTDFSFDDMKQKVVYDTLKRDEYHFLSRKLMYKPDILINAIHIWKDQLYSKKNEGLTIRHMSDLGVFRFVNIRFVEVEGGDKNYLDCMIYLSPAKKQTIGLDAEANNNTDYLLGFALTLSYGNKNLFKGAELFDFNISTGIESNPGRGFQFFNTVDFTTSADLYFNKFIVPFKVNFRSKNIRPKTRISLKYNFLRRINYYTINSTSISFGYDWKETANKRHVFNPIVVNLVRVNESSSEFQDVIDQSQTLRNSFTEQLIMGMEYSYIWTSFKSSAQRSVYYFRGNVSTAGNFLHGIYSLVHIKDDTDPPFKIFNINYAQYLLFSGDGRNYLSIGKHSKLVSRIFGGFGLPYANSEALPYVKQFYSGGSNGIRAWRVRTLGPGSFNIEESSIEEDGDFVFDQTGEIKLEGNVEYRFDIVSFLKGALFLDAGNIWTLKSDTLRPGANFDIRRFHKEFALGTGFGIRVDFTYFVLRFDIAFPIRDPGVSGNRWVIKNFNLGSKAWRRENLTLNLAIGYPF